MWMTYVKLALLGVDNAVKIALAAVKPDSSAAGVLKIIDETIQGLLGQVGDYAQAEARHANKHTANVYEGIGDGEDKKEDGNQPAAEDKNEAE